MSDSFSIENRVEFAGYIRQNYFELFDCLASLFSNAAKTAKDFSAIQIPGMEWPKLIYNLNFNAGTNNLFDQISAGIAAESLPQLLLINEFSKPDDFDAEIRNYRFIPVARWKGMLFDLLTTAIPHSSSGLVIEPVNNSIQLADWVSIQNKVFFKNEGIHAKEFEKLLTHPEFQLYLGFEGSVPASAMMIFTREKIAGFYLVATLPEYTRRGYMTRMMTYALQKLKDEEYEFAILGSTDQSHLPYQRIGFKDICNFDVFWKSR